jgi:hypothetical protein
MTQIYASYVAKFLDRSEVRVGLWLLMGDNTLSDWQRMWILAALSKAPTDMTLFVRLREFSLDVSEIMRVAERLFPRMQRSRLTFKPPFFIRRDFGRRRNAIRLVQAGELSTP